MKQTGILLAIITGIMILPWPVEHIAQHDALGPIIGLTVLLAIVAAIIFALPSKSRR